MTSSLDDRNRLLERLDHLVKDPTTDGAVAELILIFVALYLENHFPLEFSSVALLTDLNRLSSQLKLIQYEAMTECLNHLTSHGFLKRVDYPPKGHVHFFEQYAWTRRHTLGELSAVVQTLPIKNADCFSLVEN